jgi:hypothetical protein
VSSLASLLRAGQCSFNALEWREATLERLSNVPAAALIQALPKRTCAADIVGDHTSSRASVCQGAAGKNGLSTDTEIEWSGKFTLKPGSTYSWNFHASTGCKFSECTTSYPDPAIEIFVVAANLLTDKEGQADTIMKAPSSTSVVHNGAIDMGKGGSRIPVKSILTMKTIASTDTSMITTFLLTLPSTSSSTWWFFTQHVPHEFSANFLTCTSGACKDEASGNKLSNFVFPTQTSLYLGATNHVNQAIKDKVTKVTSNGLIMTAPSPKVAGAGRRVAHVSLLVLAVAFLASVTSCACIL